MVTDLHPDEKDEPLTEDELSKSLYPRYSLESDQHLLIFKAERSLSYPRYWVGAAIALLPIIWMYPGKPLIVVPVMGVVLVSIFWIHKYSISYKSYSKELIANHRDKGDWDSTRGARCINFGDVQSIHVYSINNDRKYKFEVTWVTRTGEIFEPWECEYRETAEKLAQKLSELTGKPLINAAPKL